MPDRKETQKVLILEDEPVISKILCRSLKASGVGGDIAADGLIAKGKIESGEKYDAFIFDIRTPVINGIQLYEFMESKYPALTQKVLFMTGDSLSAITSSFLKRVKRPYIIKPFTPHEIIEMIKPILQQDISTT
jgi:DNA-binding response OmpR family regulator